MSNILQSRGFWLIVFCVVIVAFIFGGVSLFFSLVGAISALIGGGILGAIVGFIGACILVVFMIFFGSMAFSIIVWIAIAILVFVVKLFD